MSVLSERSSREPLRVLVVEDDHKLAGVLARGLAREGYAIEVATRGDSALERATETDFDVVLLDVMLPGMDGFAVCRGLRRQGRAMPVLMLTARGDVSDRIEGLDAGADDYLVKPFAFGELLARLRALARRAVAERPPGLAVGDLVLDAATRMVTRDGRPVELTAREYDVLECLARDAGDVVSRTQLLERVWHEDPAASPNVVDVYVGYLRKKLERPGSPRLIRTIRGVGFLLEQD